MCWASASGGAPMQTSSRTRSPRRRWRVSRPSRRREDHASLRVRSRAQAPGGGAVPIGRGTDAGGDHVAHADGEGLGRGGRPPAGRGTLRVRSVGPHLRRRFGVLRHAGGRPGRR
ncbi:unnamed protein product, partial [Ectocarpus sp. 12 AP-2014]